MRIHSRVGIEEPAADLHGRRLRVLALAGEVPRQSQGQTTFAHADNARGVGIVIFTLRVDMPIAANVGQPVGTPRVWPPVGPQTVVIVRIAARRAQFLCTTLSGASRRRMSASDTSLLSASCSGENGCFKPARAFSVQVSSRVYSFIATLNFLPARYALTALRIKEVHAREFRL